MAIIKNFGLRWLRERVDWGGRGRAGCLMGKRIGAKTSEAVDFRDQIGIYVLYEAGFSPIYIGQAGFGRATLFGRLKTHQNDHLRDRWTHFSWFGFRDTTKDGLSMKQAASARTGLSYNDALDEIEGVLIQVLEPPLNKQGPSWRKHAKEYIQHGLPAEADAVQEIREKVRLMGAQLEKLEALLRRSRS